jgi:3-hydroxyacyl-CoA dehydrogenase
VQNALAVTIEKRSPVALVRIDYPPVNALSKSVRQGLLDAMHKLAGDKSVAIRLDP